MPNGGSPITGYNVYRGAASDSESLLAGIGNMTSYTNSAVTGGQTYFYKVTAVNANGESAPSGEASVMVSGISMTNVQSASGNASDVLAIANFDAGAGSNRLLVVGTSANNDDVESVTFGGVPLARVAYSFYNNDAEFWYLKNPGGTGNIAVTMNGPTEAVIGAYSFSGVNQTAPIATHAQRHNTTPGSPAISLMATYPNDLVIDLQSICGGSVLSSPCTQHWNSNVLGQITGASSSTLALSAGIISCKWTASSPELWDSVAVELRTAG